MTSAAVVLPAVPFELRPLGADATVEHGDDWLRLRAGPATDWFVDPSGERDPVGNAPALLGSAAGDYVLSATVTVEFASTFDAGALMLYVDDRRWAKLCFERSPEGHPTVVSVVTQEVSDDCNSWVVREPGVRLRIARIGRAFAFHAGSGAAHWELVRHFSLGGHADPRIGFVAQSPTGDGCTATFADVRFAASRLADLRDGT